MCRARERATHRWALNRMSILAPANRRAVMSNPTHTNAEPSEPLGTITEVHGPVAVIACERLPPLREALYHRSRMTRTD